MGIFAAIGKFFGTLVAKASAKVAAKALSGKYGSVAAETLKNAAIKQKGVESTVKKAIEVLNKPTKAIDKALTEAVPEKVAEAIKSISKVQSSVRKLSPSSQFAGGFMKGYKSQLGTLKGLQKITPTTSVAPNALNVPTDPKIEAAKAQFNSEWEKTNKEFKEAIKKLEGDPKAQIQMLGTYYEQAEARLNQQVGGYIREKAHMHTLQRELFKPEFLDTLTQAELREINAKIKKDFDSFTKTSGAAQVEKLYLEEAILNPYEVCSNDKECLERVKDENGKFSQALLLSEQRSKMWRIGAKSAHRSMGKKGKWD